MRKGASLGYLTKEGFRNVYINKPMSIASISVLFSCLIMIGSAFLIFVNINATLENLEKQNIIKVYYSPGFAGAPGDQLNEAIKNTPNVDPDSVTFKPNEEAYMNSYKVLYPGSDAYSSEDIKLMADSYELRLINIKDFDSTVSNLRSLEYVESVSGNRDVALKLETLRSAAYYTSTAVIAVLLAVSLFIIANTIKITMFSRRLEISIMRSVGATNRFIRWPFMLEGVIIGVISGILAIFAVWGIYNAGIRVLFNMIKFTEGEARPFSGYVLILLSSFLAIGIFAGLFGSTVSITKYLKEKEFVNDGKSS